MSHREVLKTTLEAISYQGGSGLFVELTAAFKWLKEQKLLTGDTMRRAKIDDIVMKYSGISIDCRLGTQGDLPGNAHAIMVMLGPNSTLNSFINNLGYGEYQEDFVVNAKQLKTYCSSLRGSIDFKNAKVSGVFSKLPTTIRIGTILVNQLEPEELAAVFLHELGHVFTGFSTLMYTVTSNLAVVAASDALSKAASTEERLNILHIYEDVNETQVSDVAEAANKKMSSTGYSVLLLRDYAQHWLRSSSGSVVYDFTGAEFSADQFATMHGAGRHLGLALDKIMTLYGHNVHRSTASWILAGIAKLAFAIVSAFLGNFRIIVSYITVVFVTILFSPYHDLDRYDSPADRFTRIRNNMIQALKSDDLDRDEKKRLTDDIDKTNALLKTWHDHSAMLDILWRMFNPAGRRRYKLKVFQKELEGLVNNNLFLTASKFDQMSTAGV